eukprot:1363038-Karenia_brevis.AAC.1
MRQLEPSACIISFNAVISACGIGGQWQRLATVGAFTFARSASSQLSQLGGKAKLAARCTT